MLHEFARFRVEIVRIDLNMVYTVCFECFAAVGLTV